MTIQIIRILLAITALVLLSEIVGYGVSVAFSTKVDYFLQFLIGIGTLTTTIITYEFFTELTNKGVKNE